jgi:nucleoside-diphosphate-sugar epimerase
MIVIFGSNGYLGSMFYEYLKQEALDVVGVVRAKDKNKITASCIFHDYQDPNLHLRLPENSKFAVNFTGPPAHSFKYQSKNQEIDIQNTTSTIIRSINQSNIKRVINISSLHIYSSIMENEFSESSELNNQHPYAQSHRNKEEQFKKLLKDDIQLTNLRLANVFGAPSEHKGDSDNLLINQIVKALVNGETYEIKNKKDTMRNFLTRDDFVLLLKELILNKKFTKSGPLNLGGVDASIYEITNYVSGLLKSERGINGDIRFLDQGKAIRNYFQFNCNLALENGLKPRNDFKKAILDLYDFYSAQREV